MKKTLQIRRDGTNEDSEANNDSNNDSVTLGNSGNQELTTSVECLKHTGHDKHGTTETNFQNFQVVDVNIADAKIAIDDVQQAQLHNDASNNNNVMLYSTAEDAEVSACETTGVCRGVAGVVDTSGNEDSRVTFNA